MLRYFGRKSSCIIKILKKNLRSENLGEKFSNKYFILLILNSNFGDFSDISQKRVSHAVKLHKSFTTRIAEIADVFQIPQITPS